MEYYAPSFVRASSEREFHQKVAVFSAAAREKLLQLIPDDTARGKRLDVQGVKHGTSARYLVSALPGLPREFPSVLPSAFDVLPFIRARYGKSQEPGNGPVFLPSFRCEAIRPSGPGAVKDLAVTAADCAPDADELARMKELIAARATAAADKGGPGAAAPVPPGGKVVSFVVKPADPAEVEKNAEARRRADDLRRQSIDAGGVLGTVGAVLDSITASLTPSVPGRAAVKGGAR